MRIVLIIVLSLSILACQDSMKNTAKNPISDVTELGLIPKPQKLSLKEGSFLFAKNIPFVFEKEIDARLKKLISSFGMSNEIVQNSSSSGKVSLVEIKQDTLPKGAYFLSISPEKIEIKAKSARGFYYALETFRQLLPDTLNKSSTYLLPAIEIYDYPKFEWRGVHLDVGRHFFPKEFIKKYIDQLAKHKMNVFHWHLTEDQGWRIEIKKYPKLTSISSRRKETIVEKNFNPYVGDGIEYGGFYTQEDIKEIVAYAEDRFVTIVPEIEMPGHSLAALAAYPVLSCTGGPFEVGTKWGVYEDVYCAGNEEVFTFLEGVLDEVITLFPSKYIHIGGDECPKSRWKECPKCQARMKAEGLKDEHELQSYFISRIERYLLKKGHYIIGWDEILEGGLAPQATVMSWRGEKGGIEAAQQGHNVVMTPGRPCYFDHYQSEDRENEPLAIGGYNSLEAVYSYYPIPEEISPENQKFILGAQANVWTEYMPDSKQVEYMLLPRLCALSEVVWTAGKEKDFPEFERRMKRHYNRLTSWGINYRKNTLDTAH